METMYDRLGDLLSETLEAGHVKFVKSPKIEPSGQEESRKNASNSDDEINGSGGIHEQEPSKESAVTERQISPEIERAYRLLSLSMQASSEDIKKAYKEKLMYFHPDKHRGNPILEKVATDKTRQVVEAYNLIMSSLKK